MTSEQFIEEKKDAVLSAFKIGGIDAVLAMHTQRVGPVKEAPSVDGGVRWSTEAMLAAIMQGWDVLEMTGTSDYQGWGRLLLRRELSMFARAGDETDAQLRLRMATPVQWATLRWDYGSCGGCDSYEDLATNDVVEKLAELIDLWESEEKARLEFEAGGW